jgi:hypothetical protein
VDNPVYYSETQKIRHIFRQYSTKRISIKNPEAYFGVS